MKKINIGSKLALLIVLIVMLFVGLSTFSVLMLRKAAFSERMKTAKAATDIGYNIIRFNFEKYKKGELTLEQAQRAALEQLSFIRYEGSEYFWVNDSTLPYPTMIMHPIKSLDGKVLNNPKYNVAMGRHQNLFQAFAEVCRDHGEGFVNYLWPHPGESNPVAKISYVKLFKEWNWIVGSGIYIDTVNQEVIGVIAKVIIGIILLTLLALIMSYFLSKIVIVNPIRKMISALKNISQGEGDLTQKLEVQSNDEIAEMAKYFNLTFDKIRSLVSIVKNNAISLQNVGVNLSSSMDETTSAMNEINANIQSIKKQTENQSASITETSTTMEQLTKNIENLDHLIKDQTETITKSSSNIEQMTANIGRVTDSLIKNNENITRLTNSSEAGKIGLDQIAHDILKVANESEGLLKITQVIQDIASQTDLLSMNASIEAAHAGESGKGFAIVADEIRKLAENAGNQAKMSATVLKRIKDAIEGITISTKDILSKFETIQTEVQTVAEQEKGIRNTMEEQSMGSKQILEAIGVLNDITKKVQAGSQEMLTGSQQVSKEASNMNTITQEITNGMEEMAAGAEQVAVAVNKVDELSNKNKSSIEALMKEVGKFKVE